MIHFFKDDEKRSVLFLVFSAFALLVSFFQIKIQSVDAAWAAILLCGIPILKGAFVGLVRKFDIKADVLVSIALIASICIGEIFAAGEIAFIMTIGAYLEDRTVAKARAGIEKLVQLSPNTARVVRNGKEKMIPADEVQIGDVLRILAGETVSADGVILKGQTSINQSIMTGEALPVDKNEGDEVFSGTINQFGSFDMVAQKVGEDSSLQQMIRLVESADAGKAKIVGIADRWATWIVVTALLAAGITWFATGEIIRSVTILVVFCPCALVLATPTAIMAAIGNATKFGILVREGDALERLAQIKCIAFDKTGTLTYGKPIVTQVHIIDPSLDRSALLTLAAIAELRSEHPLGKAVVADYHQKHGTLPAQPEEFKLLAGRGVVACIAEQTILAGNETLMTEQRVILPNKLLQLSEKSKTEGCTMIYLARDGYAIGSIALSDTLRPEAPQMVEEIHRIGVRTVLLTGDGENSASHIAKTAGIWDVRANCLPEHKMAEIGTFHNNRGPVCMVGDGINDAPALKTALVGIAMGDMGSDIAIDAADIVLVSDDIAEIPHLLQLAKKTMQTIRVNLTASLSLNFIAIFLAITGILNPVVGALIHNIGSIAVMIHSSLLLKWRKKRILD